MSLIWNKSISNVPVSIVNTVYDEGNKTMGHTGITGDLNYAVNSGVLPATSSIAFNSTLSVCQMWQELLNIQSTSNLNSEDMIMKHFNNNNNNNNENDLNFKNQIIEQFHNLNQKIDDLVENLHQNKKQKINDNNENNNVNDDNNDDGIEMIDETINEIDDNLSGVENENENKVIFIFFFKKKILIFFFENLILDSSILCRAANQSTTWSK